MAKKAEMKRKLLEQRDQILAEIEALRNKVKGLEMAIALVDGDNVIAETSRAPRRSGTKGTILDMLGEVGTTGLNGTSAVEMAARRGVHLDKQSVSSLLSRLKRDKIVVHEGDNYKLAQFATRQGADVPSLKVVPPAA